MAAKKGAGKPKKQLRTVKKTSTQSKTPRGTTQSTYGKAKSKTTRNAPLSLINTGGKHIMNPSSDRAANRSYHANWGGAEGPKKSTPRKKK